MPITHPGALARLAHVVASLDLAGDPDYDYADHPLPAVRSREPYFSEWDFDIPTGGSGYFDDFDDAALDSRPE